MEQEDLAISPHMDFTGAISILIINFYQLQQKKREKDTKTERISDRRREKNHTWVFTLPPRHNGHTEER